MMNKVAYNAIINNAQKSTTGRMNAVIPVDLIDVDPLYQRVEGRNKDKLNKLRKEWNYDLMDALKVVPHPETFNFFVVDGLGRLTIAKEIGIEEVDCVIISGPNDPKARRVFEATYFLKQGVCTDPLRPVSMHNARVIGGDAVAIAIENVCKENGVAISATKGNRSAKTLGSYSRTYRVARQYGVDALRWVFDVIKYSGFNEEPNGYSGKIVSVLGKFFDGYRSINAKDIGEFLRDMSLLTFQSKAVAAYPERAANNAEIPMILYLQDWAAKNQNKEIIFDLNGKKMKLVPAA